MKEKIYTIPVNEAFDEPSECPMCQLASKLEEEAVEYALGPAMMEPDYRVLSNEKGYCNKHYGMLFKKPNKLSLSLVMDTHLEELRKTISEVRKCADRALESKGGIFRREKKDSVIEALMHVNQRTNSCVVCEKTEYTMERYIRVLFSMWESEEEFRLKLENSKGFCIPHFSMLIENAKKHLCHKKYVEFCSILCKKQENELKRVHDDVHNFTLKFDYRSNSKQWGSEKDGPVRGVEKIAGYIIKDNK